MRTIYIIPIEPIDQRYTKQWYENIPLLIAKRAEEFDMDVNIVTIDGEEVPDNTTSGAFLNFAATNVYKSSQAVTVSKLFTEGKINKGDIFLVTDAWNFIITPIKYMSELLDIPVEIHSIWHAGAYDPSDILGLKMSKPWPWSAEASWYFASDYNYYATDFHKDMFLNNLAIDRNLWGNKAVRSGQPHDPIIEPLLTYNTVAKQDKIMWPHRYNEDKQPSIAEDLGKTFDMVITQKMNLSKADYYAELGRAKVIFSCALHENLGISVMEATLAGAIPIVPDRCSYKEMYLPVFKYPAEWTSSFEAYTEHKQDLEKFIQDKLDNYENYIPFIKQQQTILINDYLKADIMIDNLLGINTKSHNGDN